MVRIIWFQTHTHVHTRAHTHGHTEGVVMKVLELWASLRMMQELWATCREAHGGWMPFLLCCSRKGERSCRQPPHPMFGETSSCQGNPWWVKSSQGCGLRLSPTLLPIHFLTLITACSSSLSGRCARAAPWPCYPIPCWTQAQPPPSAAVSLQQPLHSSLSSRPLTEKQMDLLHPKCCYLVLEMENGQP